MARVLLVALVWSAGAGAARADEYGGASMPQYGDVAEDAIPGSALDYRGHSPDAPAPLDYKYEEEPQDNTEKSTKDTIESDTWKRPARKQRGLRRDRDESFDGRAYAEPLPKMKASRAFEPRVGGGGEKPVRRYRGRRGRSRDRLDSQPAGYLDKGDYRIDKNHINIILGEDIDTFNPRESTERIKRRKPRDKLLDNYVKPLRSDDLDSDEDFIADRKLKSSSSLEHAEDGRAGGGGGRFGERERERERERDRELEDERERYRPALAPPPELPEDEDEDDDAAERPRGRHKPKAYHDYSDYYEMRRLHNIKSQLPMLLRRTTTRSPPPGGAGEPYASASASGTTVDLMALLWTARRAAPSAATFAPAAAAPALPETLTPHNPDPDPENAPIEPAEATTTTPTITKTTQIPIRTSSETTTSELSIAEKSRLSILKKSQKKENDKGEPSKKPPVLLQVTSKMPTIVMVEPPTSADPWMRARHISEHSPQKLEKVKRLMRHKLVAGAKSIQDLTDNWDDMVCDYIDVSLLDNAIAHKMSRRVLCVTLAFVFVIR